MRILKKILIFLLTATLLATGVFCYSRYVEPNLLTLKSYELQVPQSVSECKVVFFSDTHFGRMYDQTKIKNIVKKINSLNPDIVIFGGDLIDKYAKDHSLLNLDYIGEELASINSKYGKYAVFGNHDYGGGAVRIYESLMNSGGFKVIKNDNEFIEELSIRLIGYDDLLMGYTDPSLYSVKSEDFNLILSHEPDVVNNISLPNNSIMLSGHSHGGQVTLPYITEKVLPTGAKEYINGKYSDLGINKNVDLFVSKGIGMTSVPFRFLNLPEIMALDLKH